MEFRRVVFAAPLGLVLGLVAAACAHAPDAGDTNDYEDTADGAVAPADAGAPTGHPDDATAPAEASSPVDASPPPRDGAAPVDSAPPDAGHDASWGPAPDIEAVLTADNAYGFGWGDVNGITTYTP